LRIKEQETRLTLHEHDDDDDMWCWIVGYLVDFEGCERKGRDLYLSRCCITCLEFPKKVKKILGKECCLLILSALYQDNGQRTN
jgi:hypothetical protein